MLDEIHHVAIIASDYERSKDFYVNKLGFSVIREIYREERDSYKLDLRIGQAQIELFSFPHPPERVNYPEAAGLRHLCFSVENIEEVVQWLNDQDIPTEPIRVDDTTGQRFTFFNDPDNLPLEVYEK